MKKNKKMRRSVVSGIVLVILFGVIFGGVMYWERHILPQSLLPAESTEPNETAHTAATEAAPVQTEPTQPTADTIPTLPEDALNGKQTLHILLTGQDRREADAWGRSDTMILCSIDARTNTVTMVSFLRDIYLKIPGYSSNRLNAAYSWGGVELLNETLKENFHVPIDGNIEIDFYGFMNMIDYLGGVDMELTAQEAEYLNENGNWDVDSDVQWDLKEGMNHLDGSQALAYSRIRYLDSDFGRTERQRKILTQLLGKFQTLSDQELLSAIDLLLDQCTTNLSEQELLLYALGFYPVLMDGDVVTQQIPADGTYSFETIKGMSVIDIDLEANQQILAELLPQPESE